MLSAEPFLLPVVNEVGRASGVREGASSLNPVDRIFVSVVSMHKVCYAVCAVRDRLCTTDVVRKTTTRSPCSRRVENYAQVNNELDHIIS